MTVGSAEGSPNQRLSNAPNNWVEWLRARQPEGSWRRRLYDRLVVPVGDPSEFTGDEESLAQELTPNTGDPGRDNERATELLAEAQAIYERAEERATGAQTRATTLQGRLRSLRAFCWREPRSSLIRPSSRAPVGERPSR